MQRVHYLQMTTYHSYYIPKAVNCYPSSPPLQPEEEGNKDSGSAEVADSKQHYRAGFNYSGLIGQARELRKNQTPAEDTFWHLVRERKFFGLKFRRQHQIGFYVVDFYCHECRLVIELDGNVHQAAANEANDKERDWNLTAQGFTVLRFSNEQIFNDLSSVFETIRYESIKAR